MEMPMLKRHQDTTNNAIRGKGSVKEGRAFDF